MQGRGLKLLLVKECFNDRRVAPHAGAWIETRKKRLIRHRRPSPLMQGRGLKPRFDAPAHGAAVAPHAGAWIETENSA